MKKNIHDLCSIYNSRAGVFNVFKAKDPQTYGEMEQGPPTIYILYTIAFYIKLGLVPCINIATLLLCIQY